MQDAFVQKALWRLRCPEAALSRTPTVERLLRLDFLAMSATLPQDASPTPLQAPSSGNNRDCFFKRFHGCCKVPLLVCVLSMAKHMGPT